MATHIIEYNGEKHSIKEWSNILNIHKNTLSTRITKLGWPIGQALGFEKREISRNGPIVEYNGVKHTISEWSRITGLQYSKIRERLIYDWSVGEALGFEKREK